MEGRMAPTYHREDLDYSVLVGILRTCVWKTADLRMNEKGCAAD